MGNSQHGAFYTTPSDIYEAIDLLEEYHLGDVYGISANFPMEDEETAVQSRNKWDGSVLRVEWKLWHPHSSALAMWFISTLHVWDAEDMSEIILRSLHRRVRGLDLDLQGQRLAAIRAKEAAGCPRDRYLKFLDN